MKATMSFGMVLLSLCFGSCDKKIQWTKETARKEGELVLAQTLESARAKRSDFAEPLVELENGSGIVTFRRLGTEDDGYTVLLAEDGCISVSPHARRSVPGFRQVQ
jgi:hypothetical protein